MKFDLVVSTAKETRRRLFSRFIHTDNFPGQDQFHPQWSRYCAAFKFQLIIVVLIYYFLQCGGSGALSTRICTSLPSAKEDRSVYLARTIYLTSEQIEKSNIWQTDELWGAISNASNWLPKRCGMFSSGKDSPREWCQRECVSFQLKAIHFTWDVSFQVSNVPIISHPAHRSAAMKRITWTKGSFGTLFKSAIAHLARRKQLEREDKWNRNNTNVLKE